ncbi:MAG: aspartate carbamoyltransferase [Bacilli bacterium]|nr:aspartate carbamoyltransferase [Bacilli bacterium]
MSVTAEKVKEEPGIGTRCIRSQQFDLDTLYKLCELTDKIRNICQTKEGSNYISSLLNDKRAMLYFKQPSTRTFLSFQNACHILGIKCSEIRDISTSSFMKGETELDGVKTFSQYVDLIIMRHTSTDFVNLIDSNLNNNMRIINAGSGTDQHPTQALLDFYTIYKYGFKNKKIAFVGDLNRGRTVRSLALMLSKIDGMKLYFIAPNGYQIKSDILEQLEVPYELTDDLESIMPLVDYIYMTRLQDEYGGIEETWDPDAYKIDLNNVNRLKNNAIILHPLPRRDEIAVEIDNDPRAKYWEQTANGLWVRVALIASMFNISADDIDKSKDYNKIKRLYLK